MRGKNRATPTKKLQQATLMQTQPYADFYVNHRAVIKFMYHIKPS